MLPNLTTIKNGENKDDSDKNEEKKIEVRNEELDEYIRYYENLMQKRLRVKVDKLREETIK